MELNKKCSFPTFYAHLELSSSYFAYWKELMHCKRNRRGEVIPVICDAKQRLLLHTKQDYPNGVFRLPTGGIHPTELAYSALQRECHEETGLVVTKSDFLFLLLYEFYHGKQSIAFSSYVYKVAAGHFEPHPTDPNEKISGFKWIEAHELPQIIESFKDLPKFWQDWGLMRLVPHQILFQLLSPQ